jgi:excisionase family DNA binding protein
MTTQITRNSVELLTVQEVAEALRVDYSTVRRWIGVGALEAVKLPSGMGQRAIHRVRRETVNAILNPKS